MGTFNSWGVPYFGVDCYRNDHYGCWRCSSLQNNISLRSQLIPYKQGTKVPLRMSHNLHSSHSPLAILSPQWSRFSEVLYKLCRSDWSHVPSNTNKIICFHSVLFTRRCLEFTHFCSSAGSTLPNAQLYIFMMELGNHVDLWMFLYLTFRCSVYRQRHLDEKVSSVNRIPVFDLMTSSNGWQRYLRPCIRWLISVSEIYHQRCVTSQKRMISFTPRRKYVLFLSLSLFQKSFYCKEPYVEELYMFF
jgi:hypothetical protein